MLTLGTITQPSSGSLLDSIATLALAGPLARFDVAAAYVTTGGAHDLVSRLRSGLGSGWPTLQKRWITSFDYCRSEPLALEALRSLPNSEVRIHDADRLLRQGCTPATPFHPKVFIFAGGTRRAALAGSGNVSRSGLKTGHEVGLSIEWTTPSATDDTIATANLDAVDGWFTSIWSAALPLSQARLAQYKAIYESVERLTQPTPTEDDLLPNDGVRSSLSAEDLAKLRVCTHFWIEAGNITKNLAGC